MEDAIVDMNNQDLNGRTITVNEAQPKPADDPRGYDNNSGGRGGRGYSSSIRGPGGGGGGYHDRDRGRGLPAGANTDCFKCGRPGHWARECPSGDGGGERFSSRPRFGGGPGGRGTRFGGGGGGGRYVDDRYDGGRYGDRDRDRDRFDGRSNGRDRYSSDRYGGDSYGDRYVGVPDRYPVNGFGKERGGGYDRDVPRGGVDRYVSGGPTRYEGGGGYRERPGPYDRPPRVGRPSSYDR